MGIIKGDARSLAEPKTYTISKFRLYTSIIGIVIFLGVLIFNTQQLPLSCFAFIALFAIFQLFPFTYKLIVSDEAISSINILGVQTLEWAEATEIGTKNGNLLLYGSNRDVKVTVNHQIDDYPEVIKFIKQQRPDLWRVAETSTFHLNDSQSVVLIVMSILTFLVGVWVINIQGFTREAILPMLVILALSLFFFVDGSRKVQKLTLDGDLLILHYLLGKRQYHVSEVWAVVQEQKLSKNSVIYPVHIRTMDRKDIVMENVKEGNPFLVNAIEMWIEKYKGKQNDYT